MFDKNEETNFLFYFTFFFFFFTLCNLLFLSSNRIGNTIQEPSAKTDRFLSKFNMKTSAEIYYTYVLYRNKNLYRQKQGDS